MPKQVQAQQQTVIVQIAPEKKKKRKTRRRKPAKATEPSAYELARPIAVYTPLAPAPPREDFGSMYRELLATLNTIKMTNDQQKSWTPVWERRPTATEMIMPEVSMTMEPTPPVLESVATTPNVATTETQTDPMVNLRDVRQFVTKYINKVDSETRGGRLEERWSLLTEDQKQRVMSLIRASNSKLKEASLEFLSKL